MTLSLAPYRWSMRRASIARPARDGSRLRIGRRSRSCGALACLAVMFVALAIGPCFAQERREPAVPKALAPWYADVVARIYQHRAAWSDLTKTLRKADPSRAIAPVVILVEISGEGSIVASSVQEGSGIGELDASAIECVRMSAPFAPLPSAYSGIKVTIPIRFAAQPAKP